jgi:hypothetical protein
MAGEMETNMYVELVTESELVNMGACDEGVEWVKRNFPYGAPLTAEVLALVPARWLVWLAGKKYPDLRFTWAGISMRYRSKYYPSLAEFADRVTLANCQRALEAAEAAYNEARAKDDSFQVESASAAVSSLFAAASVFESSFMAAREAAKSAGTKADEAWTEMSNISVRYLLLSK